MEGGGFGLWVAWVARSWRKALSGAIPVPDPIRRRGVLGWGSLKVDLWIEAWILGWGFSLLLDRWLER